jgi:serine phosphatase RsbU (regulator of sigma subunit)
VVIPNDSALVFYTDGLIEVVRDLDEGSDEVMRASRPANAIVRAVLAADNALDDIAVLVATFLR